MAGPTPDPPAPDSPAEAPKPRATNPFAQQDLPAPAQSTHFPYMPTNIPQQVLRKLPYKTSNRILDDMRLTPAFAALRDAGAAPDAVTSLLAARPVDYRHVVAGQLAAAPYACLVLNNHNAQAPSVSRHEHPDDHVVVSVVRGLVVDRERRHLSHFKLQVLDQLGGVLRAVDKNQYHVVPRALVSVDDLSLLSDAATTRGRVLDDVFFKSLNNTGHMLRVTVYGAEFSPLELAPMTDHNLIRERFLRGVEANPTTSLSPDEIPSAVQCFSTLLKVLKGPILLPPTEAVHTINISKTSLDAKVDLDLLYNNFAFSLDDSKDNLVPPNLAHNPALRESYIRKSCELIYLGKFLYSPKTNDFDVTYSFSDNLSQVHTILAEVDKHATLSMSRGDNSDKYPEYVALSCFSFYQDELIIRCYEHMVNSDPDNKRTYVDCFLTLLGLRSYSGSGRLLAYYNHQYMKGQMYGSSDLREALEGIGIPSITDPDEVTEDAIVEIFRASCKADPKNYPYFNRQLKKIAAIKKSVTLEDFISSELVPPAIALEELRIEDLTEDEVVVTAYEYRLDEVMQSVNFNASSPEIQFLQKCLLSIAVARKSYILMSYIDIHMPELLRPHSSPSLLQALAILDIQESSSDFEVISNFQEKLTKSSHGDDIDIRTLRLALDSISLHRNSDILLSFLKSGKINPLLLPAENWPTGLDNIGNTCYLNSLLQYYFCIKPLRDAIINFDEKNVDVNKLAGRKIGGRCVEESEIYRSFQFIYRLQELFNEMILTPKRYILPSKELAYLSFLPLSQPVTFESGSKPETTEDKNITITDAVIDSPSDCESKESDMDLIEIGSQSSVEDLSKHSIAEVAPEEQSSENLSQTRILEIGPEQIESAIEIGRQQDVTECIENVTFQIEMALEPEAPLIDLKESKDEKEEHDLITRLFSGKTKQTITPLSGDKPPRISIERFFSLIINVGDHPRDIYDALDNYFGENVVNLDEGSVKMSSTIEELPEILQFHVQRVLFDRERLMAYKSLEVIPFGEKIYLDRYLDTEDPDVLSKRQEVFEWKTEISKLNAEKAVMEEKDPDTKLSMIEVLSSTARYLNSKVLDHEELSIEKDTIDAIENQINVLKMRLQAIETRIKNLQDRVSGQFSAYQDMEYSLFAIFIHRGEASYGHYWVYIKDPKRDIYRKYNDDTVTEVPLSEVFNFTETNTATPYYVVYLKSELMEQYVEPLARNIRC